MQLLLTEVNIRCCTLLILRLIYSSICCLFYCLFIIWLLIYSSTCFNNIWCCPFTPHFKTILLNCITVFLFILCYDNSLTFLLRYLYMYVDHFTTTSSLAKYSGSATPTFHGTCYMSVWQLKSLKLMFSVNENRNVLGNYLFFFLQLLSIVIMTSSTT